MGENEVFVTRDVELNEALALRGAKLLGIKTVGKNSGLIAGRRAIKEFTFVNDEFLKNAMAEINGELVKKEEEEVVEEAPKKKKGKK